MLGQFLLFFIHTKFLQLWNPKEEELSSDNFEIQSYLKIFLTSYLSPATTPILTPSSISASSLYFPVILQSHCIHTYTHSTTKVTVISMSLNSVVSQQRLSQPTAVLDLVDLLLSKTCSSMFNWHPGYHFPCSPVIVLPFLTTFVYSFSIAQPINTGAALP